MGGGVIKGRVVVCGRLGRSILCLLRAEFLNQVKKTFCLGCGTSCLPFCVRTFQDAIKIADEKNPIAPWDGLSPMTYAQGPLC